MSDDWQWFWASEGGRARILRDEVEGLHASLFSASAQTSRLSSQLASLSGSIESRLTALSKAFDAYVELGDVREELTAFDEPAAVRRDVVAAIDALAGGRPAAPVDPRGLDYWLPYALNAVVALVDGHPLGEGHGDALTRARELSSETDLFVVATCGALGRGAAVVDLLPAVLTADHELTEHQRLVWRAAAAGAYGDRLDGLDPAWRPQLEREPASSWSGWVARHGPTPSSGISWLHALVADPPSLAHARRDEDRPAQVVPLGTLPPATGVGPDEAGTLEPSPTDGLRVVASELIGRGMPTEAELLRRARQLRALIEDPGAAARTTDPAVPVTVVSEVRWALLEPSTTPEVRRMLQSWVAPALIGVGDALTAAATSAPATRETVRASGGEVLVTPAGADQAAVAAGVARLEAAYAVSPRPLLGWSAGAGIAALLTLVLGVVGSGWAWLSALGLVVAVIGGLRQLNAQRAIRRAGTEALARFQANVADAVARADSTERERSAALVQLTGEAADLRDRLTSLGGGGSGQPRA